MSTVSNISDVIKTKQRMIELNNYLERENFKYHTLGKPDISDAEYDALYAELVKLEENHFLFKVPNGITTKVGDVVLPGLTKAKHSSPLLSLKKVHTTEDVIAFIETIKGPVVANAKLDGLALDLVYMDQKLNRAITRGDGEIGEDVTEAVTTIRNVPKVLPTYAPMGIVEVRGEVILPVDAFEKMNVKLVEETEEGYTNPRNAVSGILRSLDIKDISTKPLAFYAYGLGKWEEQYSKPVNFHTAMTDLLNFGFSHKRYYTLNATRTSKETEEWVNKVINQFTELRPNYDIEIDGIVFGADNFIEREELGATSQYPKHSIAYKFPASIGTSSLLGVDWQVGRTGVLTPVALVEPVEVHGVTISRVTLHNPAEIDRLGIMIGDKISVSRQGDVIPKISKVFTELRDTTAQEIILPSECPVCSSTTVLNEDGNFLFCTGANVCGGRRITTIEHFASREAMNIKGLGLNTIRLFVEKGFLSDISDIYRLRELKDQLYDLDGFGSKSVDDLLDRIEKSKQTDLYRFIYGIGINGVGISTAKNLANRFNNDIHELMGASPSTLEEIDDIGRVTAELIYIYFQTMDNLYIIAELLEVHNIEFNQTVKNDSIQYFKDQVWVVTGSFNLKTRKQWEELLVNHGAKISGSVSSNTSYLLYANDSEPSKKMEGAMKHGVTVIREDELNELYNKAIADSKITTIEPSVLVVNLAEVKKTPWFEGQSWVVTGSFDFASRKEWETILEERGASVSKSVTEKTDCVLVENSLHENSNMTKAKELGVRIVQERELAELIKNARDTDHKLRIKLF